RILKANTLLWDLIDRMDVADPTVNRVNDVNSVKSSAMLAESDAARRWATPFHADGRAIP
ncbi:MAG: hypothetical protein ACM3VT_20255, partial [Solirubrobacterales bacterium]